MAVRSKARKRALDILYEADVRGRDPIRTLTERVEAGEPPVQEYATTLVEGVATHRPRIDDLISTYAVGWTLDRMPPVDRNILRIGIFELLYADDVPDGVAIAEAVALARQLSTEESPAFTNGLLARILKLKPTLSR